MSNKTMATGSGSQIIIYQAENGNTKIDVRLENELTPEATIRKFRIVQKEDITNCDIH